MFSSQQVEQLLKPINPRRVLQAQGHSHVSQQDVTAHLIRVFGFGNFTTEIKALELVYDAEKFTAEGVSRNRWDACYRCVMRLTVKDPSGYEVCWYEDASTGDAQSQVTRAAAHDLAMKSAISLAKKRCAVHLGDQFGLSLYNRGQETALVMSTLVQPNGAQPHDGDVQEGVEQQTTLGVDEAVYDTPAAPSEEQEQQMEKSIGRKRSS